MGCSGSKAEGGAGGAGSPPGKQAQEGQKDAAAAEIQGAAAAYMKKKSEADLAAEIEADRTLSWSGRVGKILSLVGLYLFVKVGTGIANNMARSAQPLIFKNKFSFDEAMMGTVMAGQFAFGGFANAFLLSHRRAL